MLMFNNTKHHLTGADRRRLRRLWRKEWRLVYRDAQDGRDCSEGILAAQGRRLQAERQLIQDRVRFSRPMLLTSIQNLA